MNCPRCQATHKQWKTGFNPSGSQRYRCGLCNQVYTQQPSNRGYPSQTRQLALRMYLEGNSLRAIGRILQVNHQSVANWVAAYAAQLPEAPRPASSQVAELDELYTFLGSKKTNSIS